MASAEKQYTSEMMKKFGGYYATWNPGVNLQLGDVGVLKNNVFTRYSNLADIGIAFEVREDTTRLPIEYQSQGAVQVTTKAAGSASFPGSTLTNADAGVVVEFSKSNSTYFKALNTTSPSIKDVLALEKAVLDRYAKGSWKSGWVIVTELIQAESATIIISNSSTAKVEVKATANLDAPQVDIANIDFGFQVQSSKGLDTTIIATEGLTPLFKVMGLKTRIFLPAHLALKKVSPMDIVTPESSKTTHKGKLYLGYITNKTQE